MRNSLILASLNVSFNLILLKDLPGSEKGHVLPSSS